MKTEGAELVRVAVLDEHWVVPRGFGRRYQQVAEDPAEPSVLSDLLALIGYDASAEEVEAWPLQRRVEAEVYAANVHVRASDNAVRRHPPLAWLPEPWKGADAGDLWGPAPTPIETGD